MKNAIKTDKTSVKVKFDFLKIKKLKIKESFLIK